MTKGTLVRDTVRPRVSEEIASAREDVMVMAWGVDESKLEKHSYDVKVFHSIMSQIQLPLQRYILDAIK